MAGFFSKFKNKVSSDVLSQAEEEGYVELGAGDVDEKAKIIVRPYIIQDFEHIKPILETLREGHTIALINIKPLKDRDLVELKRAINKIKKTCDAIDGDIAGFGEDWIAAVPSFAQIHRQKPKIAEAKKASPEITEYDNDHEI
ncbi:MAG: cell division protein SepF [Nanoarchaeota archaeon]